LDKIDQQQKQETIVLLCQIFECANLEMFYTAPYPLIDFIDRQTIDLIISLFADQECVNTIDHIDTREWIRACIQEPAQLFVPLGRELASRWLVDSWDPIFCMVMVWAVVNVLNGDNPHDLITAPSVDTVLKVARWAQFEENARWHHHVGACLSSLKHFDAAIQHLNAALALQPIWGAKRDLAEVYGDQGQLNDSLQLLRECEAQYAQLLAENNDDKITDLGKDAARDLSKLRKDLGLLYIQLGDHSNATHWFMACIELWDFVYTHDAVSLVTRVLVASQYSEHEKIMQVLKKMDRKVWPDTRHNYLMQVFEPNFKDWHIWDNTQLPLIYAVSAKRCNNLQWLECKYQSVIAEQKMQLKGVKVICLKESLAHLYDKFLGEEEKAILIWKRIIAQHRVPDSLQYERFCRARNRAVAAYAYRLLTNALRETGNPQALIVQELEKVCDTEIQSSSAGNVLFDGQPGIYMGVWHKLNGREQAARNYFRPYVIQAVSYRDEDIGEYGMGALRVLGHLFAMIGDDEDAITVLQLVHSPFTIRDGTSASAEERMASPWPLVVEDRVWYCHICLQSWGNFVNCNICRRCNADICEKCLEGLKTGGMESHACDGGHQWLNIPPPPGVPGTYQLSRDNQALSVEEYMAAIESSWM
jgi:tetratricopeptide (TPR) repeat protein